jgi:hypothetical protein
MSPREELERGTLGRLVELFPGARRKDDPPVDRGGGPFRYQILRPGGI